jgi:hypothetical protein
MNSIIRIFETFVVVDMDDSFPIRRYMLHLDSWFKCYEVLKI